MKGLYIHIPFCKQKCKYCDFVSFPCMEDTADKYVDALKREAEQYRGEKIDTIFIGGVNFNTETNRRSYENVL